MKRLLMILTIVFTCLTLFSTVAEAKRFGGGSSFGKQRSVPAQQQRAPSAPAQPAAAPAPSPSGNKWLGPLAGLAIGAGLASMFAGGGMGGFGGAMGSILLALLVGGVVMMLISKFRQSPQQPANRYAGAGAPYQAEEPFPQTVFVGSGTVPQAASHIPADFPVESFLRNGRMSFIRLQAANDRKDLDDIREYTTPEMFAEISLQLQERGDAPQKTDVITLNADLLEVATEGDYSIASVRFTGQLRENGGLPENVDEIWNVQKKLNDEKAVWLLAGIQQTVIQ